ncbi:hypothetical protein AA313_de0209629 [Arthrobotrys entomopaga]|nr:hypothetical protein AA313_de0209629 [Arthrobotrys entomopaga]
MKFFSTLFTAVCALAACAAAAPAAEAAPAVAATAARGNWVQVYQWGFRNNYLAGNIRVQAGGRNRGSLSVWYGDGRRWGQFPASYYGPAEPGYEYWTFRSYVPYFSQFYAYYYYGGVAYYDPRQGQYYYYYNQPRSIEAPAVTDPKAPPPPFWEEDAAKEEATKVEA